VRFHNSTNPSLRSGVTISATVPTTNGGTCTTGCDIYHSITIAPGDAQVVAVLFSELVQRPGGTPADWNPEEVIGLHWSLLRETGEDYYRAADLTVDDIYFY
jgi:hypothetical protein